MQTTRRLTATAALGVGIVLVAGAGVATATVGKSLLLGKTNTVKALTTLSNTKGTPLSLKSKPGKPPLAVSNSVEVPKLNAAEVGGLSATKLQRKISGEQCSQQPGSDVTGVNGATLTCDSQQAVQNGRVSTGSPTLFVHDQGEYLIFADLNLQNTGTAAGTFTCYINWSDPSAAVNPEADETVITGLVNSASDATPIALGTSGAHAIPASTTLNSVCTTTSANAVATIVGGDITAMPVAFQ